MNAAVAGVGPNMNGDVPCKTGQPVPDVGDGGVEARLRTEAHCQFEPGRTEVDGHHPLVTPVDQGGDGREPDGAAPEHRDTVARLHVRLIGSVHPDGERLGQGGDVEWEAIGHSEQPAAIDFGYQEPGGEPTLIATVSYATGLVVSRMNDHSVSGADRGDLAADPVDGARDLVTQAHRCTGRPRDAPQPDVGEIAAADATGGNGENRIAGSGLRRLDVVHPDVSRTVHSNLEQAVTPSGRGPEQKRHRVAHPCVDYLDSDAQSGAVIRPRRRSNVAGATAELQRTAALRQLCAGSGQVIAPNADVVQVGVLVAGPHRARDLLDQLEMGRFHRVADASSGARGPDQHRPARRWRPAEGPAPR